MKNQKIDPAKLWNNFPVKRTLTCAVVSQQLGGVHVLIEPCPLMIGKADDVRVGENGGYYSFPLDLHVNRSATI